MDRAIQPKRSKERATRRRKLKWQWQRLKELCTNPMHRVSGWFGAFAVVNEQAVEPRWRLFSSDDDGEGKWSPSSVEVRRPISSLIRHRSASHSPLLNSDQNGFHGL